MIFAPPCSRSGHFAPLWDVAICRHVHLPEQDSCWASPMVAYVLIPHRRDAAPNATLPRHMSARPPIERPCRRCPPPARSRQLIALYLARWRMEGGVPPYAPSEPTVEAPAWFQRQRRPR